MRILFVHSGNDSFFEISPFIKTQAESLRNSGHDIDFFSIQGKGILGYWRNIKLLRKKNNANKYTLIHAHYVLSGWLAVLSARNTPIICSFMGSDTYGDTNDKGRIKITSLREILLAKLIQPFIAGIIVKSNNLHNHIWLKKKAYILPNGVDYIAFKEMQKVNSCQLLNLDSQTKYILFLGNKKNKRKNYKLFEDSIKYIDKDEISILAPYPVDPFKVPLFINSADVLVLTSFMEGSPNVIKEAMACNCPIVSTNVGDVNWVFGSTEGCYLTTFDPADVADKIGMAISFGKRTTGRDQITSLGLDSQSISIRLVDIYDKVLQAKNKKRNS